MFYEIMLLCLSWKYEHGFFFEFIKIHVTEVVRNLLEERLYSI